MMYRNTPFVTRIRAILIVAILGVSLLSGYAVTRATTSTPPILLIVNSAAANPFGNYLAEILRAEGLNSFETVQLNSITATILADHKLAVLAETSLSASQATLLRTYVSGGGRLLAMRPDPQIASVLGITPVGSNISDGYLAIDTATTSGAGFTGTTLPFHGTANNYTLTSGATSVAQIYSSRTTATTYPAVVRYQTTATWAYDLARSVAYSRQGDPANAGVDRDGQPPIRTTDIFYNAIDLERVNLPHADIQMRLFSRLITDMLSDSVPLPQLWYFPQAKRTLLVLTSDDHGQPMSTFTTLLNNVVSRGGHISIYAPRWASNPTASVATTWRAAGHEIGLHPYAYSDGVTINQGFITNENWFAQLNRGTPSRTTRIHQIEWQGWTDAAVVEASHNIGMDTSFYTWGSAVKRADGTHAQGYITGSSLPLRFIDQSGTLLPIYQQATTLIDESMIGFLGPDASNYTAAQALAVTQQMIDASQAGNYAAMVTQFHTDYYTYGEVQPWDNGTMDYAVSLGIPMWTAERWLSYVEARAATTLSNLTWTPANNNLSLTVIVPSSVDAQSLMLPSSYGGQLMSAVTINSTPASVTTQTINGRAMSFISLGAGTYNVSATYGQSGSAPTSTLGTPTVTNTSTPTNIPGTPSVTNTTTSTPAPSTATNTSTPAPSTATNTSTPAPSTATNTSTPAPSGDLVHTTTSDFQAACVGTNGTLATLDGDGAVGLDGAFRDTFDGPSLDTTRWVAGTWNGGTYTPTFLNGAVQVIGSTGASLRSSSTFTTRTLEGVAEFGAGAWQHLGFGSLGFSGDQYLLFSTIGTSTTLFARSNSGGGEAQTNLGLIPVGRHTYRIEWTHLANGQDQIRYLIDGTLRATHTVNAAPALYAYASYNSGGNAPALQIDSLRVLPPYAASGTFTSCALDANLGNTWTTVSWIATTPVGTSLSVEVRTSADGLTWGNWTTTTAGTQIASPNRFVQYRLNLGTTDTSLTPLVTSLTLSRGQPASSTSTPISTSTLAPSTSTPISTSTLAPSTSTPISTSTLAPSTSTPISTSTSAPSTSTPTSSNTPVPATNTPVPPPSDVVHTTLADFQTACVGTNGTLATLDGDGAVGLDGAFRDTFDGPSLDTTRWVAGTWNGGTYTPTFLNGAVQVIGSTGASLRSSSTFTTRTLEGVAEFGAGAWQHLGFGSLGFSGDQYLLFSTIGTSTTLFARSNSGGGEVQTNLGAIPVGRHTYRIEWIRLASGQDQIRYLIDNTLRATHTVNAAPALYAYASYNSGGSAPALQIDSLRVLPPYAASGTFTSCALDANLGNTWTTASWIATTPVGSSLSVEVRTSADGLTWSTWATTTTGAQIASPQRFVQYRLNLGTTDTSLTPLVTSLTLSRVAATGQ
jgi:hypothetical protein